MLYFITIESEEIRTGFISPIFLSYKEAKHFSDKQPCPFFKEEVNIYFAQLKFFCLQYKITGTLCDYPVYKQFKHVEGISNGSLSLAIYECEDTINIFQFLKERNSKIVKIKLFLNPIRYFPSRIINLKTAAVQQWKRKIIILKWKRKNTGLIKMMRSQGFIVTIEKIDTEEDF